MQWRRFEQGNVPENETFLLCVDKDIFFAKVVGNRIMTRFSYADAEEINEIGLEKRGGYVEVFLSNLKKRNVFPMWAHLHKPEMIK